MRISVLVLVALVAGPVQAQAQSNARTCLTIERRMSDISNMLRELAIDLGEADLRDLGARVASRELSQALMAADAPQREMIRAMIRFSEALDRTVTAARACAR
jgi:hypothetical protein